MRRPSPLTWPLVAFIAAILILPALAGGGGKLKGRLKDLAAEPKPGTTRQTLMVGSTERSYLIHLPTNYDGKAAVPLVMVFHGGGGNGANAERMSEMSPKADAEGFIAVYPNGTGPLKNNEQLLTWNAEHCCGYAMKNNIDDIGFIRTLVIDLQRQYRIDPARIYATGMSNGGAISHRLGLEASDVFAAIAPVAAASQMRMKVAMGPIPVFMIHGDADENVPIDGGLGPKAIERQIRDPLAEVARFWVAANSCNAVPVVSEDAIQRMEKYAGPQGNDVWVLIAKGIGHTWPGGGKGRAVADDPGSAIEATDLIWDFFETHPRR